MIDPPHRQTELSGKLCLASITLRVRDLDASVGFYESVFGLTPHPTESALRRHVTLASNEDPGALWIELVEGRPQAASPTVDHFCIMATAPETVSVVVDRAKAFGVRVSEPRARGDRFGCFVFDPDGNKILVASAGPGRSAAT